MQTKTDYVAAPNEKLITLAKRQAVNQVITDLMERGADKALLASALAKFVDENPL